MTIQDRLMDKLYALMWVITSSTVMYYSDFVKVHFSTPDSSRGVPLRPVLNLSMTLFTIDFVLLAYLLLYLPFVKGFPPPHHDPSTPNTTPTSTTSNTPSQTSSSSNSSSSHSSTHVSDTTGLSSEWGRGKSGWNAEAWDVYCPRVIPTMTACGVIGCILWTRAMWPVWGFLTPFVGTIVSLGSLFALHFVPWPF